MASAPRRGFPNLSKARVGRLRIPVLIITGENTIKIPEARQRSGLLSIHDLSLTIYGSIPVRRARTRKHSMRRCLNFWLITGRESGDVD